jgi:hypothetical protein
MKRVLLSGLLCLILVSENPAAKAVKKAGSLAQVSFMVGNAKKRASRQKKWTGIRLNQKIKDGDWIKTAEEERVELKLKDGSIMRISEKAEVVISGKTGKSCRTDLKKGKIWCNIKKLGQKREDFEVSSGTAVAAIRGTVFRMGKNQDDSSTTVAVYSGKVDVGPDKTLKDKIDTGKNKKKPGSLEVREEVAGPTEVPGPYEVSLEEWVTIVAGMQINIRPDGKYDKREINEQKDAEDAWVKFNQKRDQDLKEKTPGQGK